MSKELATTIDSTTIESVVIGGDLSKLTPAQRVDYYRAVCNSIGLNPLTRPFDYITLNGRLTLYARKDATDQLRNVNQISIEKPDIRFEDDWIIVTVAAHDKDGRTDSDVGVVNKKDMQGNFGNALMKAVTKAKRRVTLSICGLGMLDETEIETIPDARPVTVIEETGEIVEPAPKPAAQPAPATNGKHTEEQLRQAVVDAGLAENVFAAKAALDKCKTGWDTPEKAIAWMTAYREARQLGGDPAQAAKIANEQPK